jgi:hypothetical protein
MRIIGVDLHARQQTIAMLDTDTGELNEKTPARKLGIRLWIMLRDQIDYQEFCRRGQLRQKNGGARAGMPDLHNGPAVQRPVV